MRISNASPRPDIRFGSGEGNTASVAKNLASGMQRVLRGQPTAATAKALEISFRPLLPLIVAGAGLLYNQGRETAKGREGEHHAWLRVLTESTLAYALLANTSGLYPLAGIALACYRAGQQNNRLDAIKAYVNTAMTMTLGYAGVKLFTLMAKADAAMDNEMIFNALKPKGNQSAGEQRMIQNWLMHLNGHNDESVRTLGRNLRDLSEELDKNIQNINLAKKEGKTPAVLAESERIGERLKQLKAEAVENFSKVKKQALEPLESGAHRKMATNLMSHLEYSQNGLVKGLRAVNPIFGYIITGLMLGAPAAAFVNRQIEKRKPQLRQQEQFKSILPGENRIWNGAGASHKGFKTGYPDIDQGLSWATAPNGQPAIFYPGRDTNQFIQ